MDIFTFTKSKTRQKILNLFLNNPDRLYYLREIERELSFSAGNIRRDLLSLTKTGLFERIKKGKLVLYKINKENTFFTVMKSISKLSLTNLNTNIVTTAHFWVKQRTPPAPDEDIYCQTRDVFQARLQTFTNHLEKKIGTDAYLVSAVAGEIGNNSFDHNLGNWPSIAGIYYAHDELAKTIVLADRGQGVLKTIRNVRPDTKDDKDALKVAFTKVLSGRSPEQRGNGLKFVRKVINDKKWELSFKSGRASLSIVSGKMEINNSNSNIYGCFAVIKY